MKRFASSAWLAAAMAMPVQAFALDVTEELSRCAACHGSDGRSAAMPANGRIAGQHREYLVYILKQYRAGTLQGVNGGIMAGAARHLDDAQIDAIARYYSTQP